MGAPIFGSIREDMTTNIEPIPSVLQAVIDHLVQWRLIPESRKPNSCLISFFDETDDKKRVEEVLQILRKQAPLTVKQEKFCSDACVERFLKSEGDNVKKAEKHLRSCLSWRESIGIGPSFRRRFFTRWMGGTCCAILSSL